MADFLSTSTGTYNVHSTMNFSGSQSTSSVSVTQFAGTTATSYSSISKASTPTTPIVTSFIASIRVRPLVGQIYPR